MNLAVNVLLLLIIYIGIPNVYSDYSKGELSFDQSISNRFAISDHKDVQEIMNSFQHLLAEEKKLAANLKEDKKLLQENVEKMQQFTKSGSKCGNFADKGPQEDIFQKIGSSIKNTMNNFKKFVKDGLNHYCSANSYSLICKTLHDAIEDD